MRLISLFSFTRVLQRQNDAPKCHQRRHKRHFDHRKVHSRAPHNCLDFTDINTYYTGEKWRLHEILREIFMPKDPHILVADSDPGHLKQITEALQNAPVQIEDW